MKKLNINEIKNTKLFKELELNKKVKKKTFEEIGALVVEYKQTKDEEVEIEIFKSIFFLKLKSILQEENFDFSYTANDFISDYYISFKQLLESFNLDKYAEQTFGAYIMKYIGLRIKNNKVGLLNIQNLKTINFIAEQRAIKDNINNKFTKEEFEENKRKHFNNLYYPASLNSENAVQIEDMNSAKEFHNIELEINNRSIEEIILDRIDKIAIENDLNTSYVKAWKYISGYTSLTTMKVHKGSEIFNRRYPLWVEKHKKMQSLISNDEVIKSFR